MNVSPWKISVMYNALRAFGGRAWRKNSQLRVGGEKRILLKFPDNPQITWDEWKNEPGVFAP